MASQERTERGREREVESGRDTGSSYYDVSVSSRDPLAPDDSPGSLFGSALPQVRGRAGPGRATMTGNKRGVEARGDGPRGSEVELAS